MTWREKCRICQELLVKVCSLLTTCIPEPNTSNNWQPFLVFIYPWQLEWPHFWWFHLSEDLYICFGSLSDLIFSSLVGKGLSSINPMDRFLFVCGTSKEGGGALLGSMWSHPIFRQNWAHGAKAKPPSSLRVWMIGPPLFISFRTSTHWASLSSVGGWTCNFADRHCCIITLMDGHPLTAFDAMPITKNY